MKEEGIVTDKGQREIMRDDGGKVTSQETI